MGMNHLILEYKLTAFGHEKNHGYKTTGYQFMKVCKLVPCNVLGGKLKNNTK